jgi:hypothetical protein
MSTKEKEEEKKKRKKEKATKAENVMPENQFSFREPIFLGLTFSDVRIDLLSLQPRRQRFVNEFLSKRRTQLVEARPYNITSDGSSSSRT